LATYCDIDTLINSVRKEKGLAISLKNIELKRQQIADEVAIRQQDFQNRMAAAQDYRDYQYLNIAYNQFRVNTDLAYQDLDLKKQQFQASLAQTQFENNLARQKASQSQSLVGMVFDERTI